MAVHMTPADAPDRSNMLLERSERASHDDGPTVSVGLAVYNGENFIEAAIDSILSQTYQDIELVIVDNSSTDRTHEDIRESYAVGPACPLFYRNPVNIGGVRNENRTLFLSCGKYFKLAAHDDTITPTFLERCVDVLEREPHIDLCMTHVMIMDDKGKTIERQQAHAGTEPEPSAADPVDRRS